MRKNSIQQLTVFLLAQFGANHFQDDQFKVEMPIMDTILKDSTKVILNQAGYQIVKDLQTAPESQLAKIKGIQSTQITELRSFLISIFGSKHFDKIKSKESSQKKPSEESNIFFEGFKNWFSRLSTERWEIIEENFGLFDFPKTLQEIGDTQGKTRERIRQIRKKGLSRLDSPPSHFFPKRLKTSLNKLIDQNELIFFESEWTDFIKDAYDDDWENAPDIPNLMRLICEINIFDQNNFYYHKELQALIDQRYSVKGINSRIKKIRKCVKMEKRAVTVDEVKSLLLSEHELNLTLEGKLLEKLISQVDDLSRDQLGRYYFPKYHKLRYPQPQSGWFGPEDSQMAAIEAELRERLESVDLIGQIDINKLEFEKYCRVIRQEAIDTHIQTKELDHQPRMVPPALFVTIMVFSARFSNEEIDRYWHPYIRSVWDREYTQAFYAQCRKHFANCIDYLEDEFGLAFPQRSEREVITPIYRHALIPAHLEKEFSDWLGDHWEEIFEAQDSLEAYTLRSLGPESSRRYSTHIRHFLTDKNSIPVSMALISNMATAISMVVNDGNSFESIYELLGTSPIEQRLWKVISNRLKTIDKEKVKTLKEKRLGSASNLQWVWSIDDNEMMLRLLELTVQRRESKFEGEPESFYWVVQDQLTEATLDDLRDLTPTLRESGNINKDGHWEFQNLLFKMPDDGHSGLLVLVSDEEEILGQFTIPPFPESDVIFFRVTQQEAYGVPIDYSSLKENRYWVLYKKGIEFREAESKERFEPLDSFYVPFPFNHEFSEADEFEISIPFDIVKDGTIVNHIEEKEERYLFGKPTLTGEAQFNGLSSTVPPLFLDHHITLKIAGIDQEFAQKLTIFINSHQFNANYGVKDLVKHGDAQVLRDQLLIDLTNLCPQDTYGVFQIDLRRKLNSILDAPIQFSRLPQIEITAPNLLKVYCPGESPRAVISLTKEMSILEVNAASIETDKNGHVEINWEQPEDICSLTLDVNGAPVPLAWRILQIKTKLLPRGNQGNVIHFDHLDRYQVRITAPKGISDLEIKVGETGVRQIKLGRKAKSELSIRQDQLYDLIQAEQGELIDLNVSWADHSWPLLQVTKRPPIDRFDLHYDATQQILEIAFPVDQIWKAKIEVNFWPLDILSTRPFKKVRMHTIEPTSFLPINLEAGLYYVEILIDRNQILPIQKDSIIAVDEVFPNFQEIDEKKQLFEFLTGPLQSRVPLKLIFQFIRSFSRGVSLHPELLTEEHHLVRLLSLPISPRVRADFETLSRHHELLFALHECWNVNSICARFGMLPAWLILNREISLVPENGNKIRVTPEVVMENGKSGIGFAYLKLDQTQNHKMKVYVSWEQRNRDTVMKAGIPFDPPNSYYKDIDEWDVLGLKWCPRCRNLYGCFYEDTQKHKREMDRIKAQHHHNKASVEDLDVMIPLEYGGYELKVDVVRFKTGSQSLLTRYSLEGVTPISASTFVPREVAIDISQIISTDRDQSIFENGLEWLIESQLQSNNELWQAVAKLLHYTHDEFNHIENCAILIALAMRTAAYFPDQLVEFWRGSGLRWGDTVRLFGIFYNKTPQIMVWAFTWTEILYVNTLSNFQD